MPNLDPISNESEEGFLLRPVSEDAAHEAGAGTDAKPGEAASGVETTPGADSDTLAGVPAGEPVKVRPLSNEPVLSSEPPVRRGRLVLWMILVVVVMGLAGAGWFAVQAATQQARLASTSAGASIPVEQLSKLDLGIDKTQQLIINGQLRVNGAVVITPGSQPAAPSPGQMYLNQTDSSLYYYNGSAYSRLLDPGHGVTGVGGQTGDIALGDGLELNGKVLSANVAVSGGAGIAVNGRQVTNSGVLSLQGQNGAVTLTSGGGLSIAGTTLTNTGVVSVAGLRGDVAVGPGLSAVGGKLVNAGVISLSSGSSNLVLTDDGAGHLTLTDTSGGGGSGYVALGPTLYQTDTTNNPALAFTKTGSGNLLQLATGASPVDRFVVSQTGAITTGSIGWSQITGVPSLVSSIVGTVGQVSVSMSGSTATLSLPQSIATTASPTFAGLSLGTPLGLTSGGTGAATSAAARSNLGAAASGTNADITSLTGLNNITPGAALNIGHTGQSLTLQGNGSTTVTATSGGITNALQFALPAGSNKAITVPNASGTVAVSASGMIALDANGNITCPTCATTGASVSSLNSLTGALTVANASASGSTITIDNASTSAKGIASFNSTNFTVTSGNVNTVQDIATTASPTFAAVTAPTLNANTITPSAALTLGATTQAVTLQGSNTTITRSSGGNVTTLSLVAPTANVTYQFQTAAAGTYDVCTTAGNCVGVGGSVSTSGGSAGAIPKYTSASALAPSLISDNGSVVTVSGGLSVTGSVSLSSPLAVTSGGTGAATLASNGVVIAHGTSALTSLTSGSAGLCLVSTAGAPAWSACPGAGGVSSLNSLTGALTVANASASGSTITIDNASTSAKGIASFNSTNFTVTSGNVNTVQDIATTASPTFAAVTAPTLNANTITPSSSLTVGATGQTFTVQGNASSTIAVTGGGATTTVGFTGTPTGAVNYQFDRAAAAGTYTVCTTAGNCVGTGGGVTSPGGTANRLAKFTAGTTIASSSISDTGTSVSIAPTSNGSATFQVQNAATRSVLDVDTSANKVVLGNATTVAGQGLAGVLAFADGTNDGYTVSFTPATLSADRSITIPNASGTLAVSASGPIQLSATGAISCPTCLTSGGGAGSAVDSLDGLTGTLTLANSTGSGSTITIDNASTGAKGIASFSSTNFTVTSGAVDTIQGISTTSAPTFAGLTLSSALGITSGGTGATTASAARSNLGAAASGTNSDITSLTGITGITSNGNFILKPSTNSTTAIQLQTAGGSPLLVADTSNGRLYVGDPAGSSTATLLVLSNQTSATDPTGIEGAMYYNATTKQFRCYRDASWETCGAPPIDRGFTLQEEFTGGSTTCGNAGTIGALGWACNGIGTGTTNLAYNTGITPTADRPGILRITPPANANAGAALLMSQTGGGSVVMSAGNNLKVAAAVASATSGTTTMRIGLSTQTGGTARSTNSGLWWEADPTVNANWQYCYSTGSGATCNPSSVAIAAGTFVRLEIRLTATGSGTSAATFLINGAASSVSSVTINTSNLVSPNIVCYAQDTTQQPCYVDYYQLTGISSAAR